MQTIHYRDMLQQLQLADHERGSNTVDLVYVKCDRERKTGGQLITINGAKKCGLPYHCKDNEMIGILRPGTSRPTAVHLGLILQFNGNTVFR